MTNRLHPNGTPGVLGAYAGFWFRCYSHPNDFIRSLAGSQQELLTRMLQEERDGAIHDVLAALTWWVISRDVGLTFRGEPMPVDLSGMGLQWRLCWSSGRLALAIR